jgi:hypothetical protein
MRWTFIQFLTVLFLLLIASDMAADSYRCGRKLIKTGDSSGDVLRICGEPYHKDRGTEEIYANGETVRARVERWYYRKNSRSVERVVLLQSGRIVAIQLGSR